jgi:NAD+ kinase
MTGTADTAAGDSSGRTDTERNGASDSVPVNNNINPTAGASSVIGLAQPRHSRPLPSPCFVHSHLERGASFADWLRNRNINPLLPRRTPLQPMTQLDESPTPSSSSPSSGWDDLEDDDNLSSLTRQLAQTAAGVREMSRQLGMSSPCSPDLSLTHISPGRAKVKSSIQNVLIITKARDNRLISLTRELALYLMMKKSSIDGRGLVVYVDHQLRHSKRFDADGIAEQYPHLTHPIPRRRSSSSSFSSFESGSNLHEEGQLRYWTSEMCSKTPDLFDFVVTVCPFVSVHLTLVDNSQLGGDGTVLFASWLFQRIVPPVLPFALGSLGFLTPFDFADYKSVMDTTIDNGIRVSLRMRFTCTVYRAVAPTDPRSAKTRRRAIKKADTGEIMMQLEKGGWESLEGGTTMHPSISAGGKDKEVMCFTTRPVETFEVLNDLVVDRGPSPYVSLLELFGKYHFIGRAATLTDFQLTRITLQLCKLTD